MRWVIYSSIFFSAADCLDPNRIRKVAIPRLAILQYIRLLKQTKVIRLPSLFCFCNRFTQLKIVPAIAVTVASRRVTGIEQMAPSLEVISFKTLITGL